MRPQRADPPSKRPLSSVADRGVTVALVVALLVLVALWAIWHWRE
jgi:hypothetical protein